MREKEIECLFPKSRWTCWNLEATKVRRQGDGVGSDYYGREKERVRSARKSVPVVGRRLLGTYVKKLGIKGRIEVRE